MAKSILNRGSGKEKKSKKKKRSSSSSEEACDEDEEPMTADQMDEQLLIQLNLKAKGVKLKSTMSYDKMTCAAGQQRK